MDNKSPVTFFILFPKQTEADCENDGNKLGIIQQDRQYLPNNKFSYYNTFTFYSNDGFKILSRCIREKPDKLYLIRIINSKGKTYTVEKFLNVLENCKIK